MDTTFRTALLIAMLMPSTLRATDRMVVLGGTAPNYPTITAALTAAVEGDRILVVPSLYTEHLTIAKSVELVSLIAGQRYTVAGNILFALPANQSRTVAIHQMRLLGRVGTTQTSNEHAIGFYGCITGTIDLGPLSNAIVTLASDSVLGRAHIKRGSITGCFIQGDTLQDAFPDFRILQAGGGGTGTVVIAGNVLGAPIETQYTIGPVTIELITHSTVRFENNYVRLYRATYVAVPIFFNDLYQANPAPCFFTNNTIHRYSANATPVPLVTDGSSGFNDYRNNFFVGPAVPIAVSGSDQAAYNMFSLDQNQLDHSTGKPVPVSVCINAGDPDNAFADLDLTRNDAGCYGGSFSRDQFDDVLPNSAIITWSDAQRRMITGTSMSIHAHGVDR